MFDGAASPESIRSGARLDRRGGRPLVDETRLDAFLPRPDGLERAAKGFAHVLTEWLGRPSDTKAVIMRSRLSIGLFCLLTGLAAAAALAWVTVTG